MMNAPFSNLCMVTFRIPFSMDKIEQWTSMYKFPNKDLNKPYKRNKSLNPNAWLANLLPLLSLKHYLMRQKEEDLNDSAMSVNYASAKWFTFYIVPFYYMFFFALYFLPKRCW